MGKEIPVAWDCQGVEWSEGGCDTQGRVEGDQESVKEWAETIVNKSLESLKGARGEGAVGKFTEWFVSSCISSSAERTHILEQKLYLISACCLQDRIFI